MTREWLAAILMLGDFGLAAGCDGSNSDYHAGGGANFGGAAGQPSPSGGGAGVLVGAGGRTMDLPSGAVIKCDGSACPNGACFYDATPRCTQIYPNPLSATSPLCSATSDDAYCIGTQQNPQAAAQIWVVTCSKGVAVSSEHCSGCGFNNDADLPAYYCVK